MDTKQAAWFLRALGDGTRLRILALLKQGPLKVGDIARTLRRPISTVSRHLRHLHARGLLEWENVPDGVLYRLTPPDHCLHEQVLPVVQACLAEMREVQTDHARAAGKRAARGRR